MSSEVKGYATFGSLRKQVQADQSGEAVAIGLTRGGHRFALISRTGISRKVYYPATPRRSLKRDELRERCEASGARNWMTSCSEGLL